MGRETEVSGITGASLAAVPPPVDPVEVAAGVPSAAEPEKPRRGRKPGAGRVSPAPDSKTVAGAVEEALRPENFRALAALPGETAAAMTGWDGWIISKGEADAIASTASQAARLYVSEDPKTLIGILFLANVLTIYGTRTVTYFADKRKREANGRKGI